MDGNSYFTLDCKVNDDVSMMVLRKLSTGWAISSKVDDTYGDLSNINTFATTLNYRADSGEEGYETYILLFANVEVNDDGGSRSLPIWLLAKPSISVLSNVEISMSDARVQEIVDLLQKDEWTEADIDRFRSTISASISQLTDKKNAALNFKERTTNDNAKEYSSKAASYYDKAIEELNNAKSTDDKEQILLSIKLAKNYEMTGDYYLSAAEKIAAGLEEQAMYDIENAEKIEEATKEYEPSMFFTAGSWLGDAWQSFKEGFGMGDVPDWVLILVVVILVVGGAIIVLKLF